MKKYFLILFALTLTFPVIFADVSIQNDQKFIGDDGAFHIVGEIQNNLDMPLNQIKIHATLYDINNQIISVKETKLLVNIIMPEMKGPFDLIVTGEEVKRIESYSLDVDYKVAAPKSQVIDIITSKLTRDNFDNLMITGTVENKGEITANTVAVIATLYDKEGNVAAVSRTHPEPDYLRTNDKTFFLVSIPDKIQTLGINDYSLIAESEEYAAVPEFPIGSLIFLAGSVSAYIGITKYSNKIISNGIFATNLK